MVEFPLVARRSARAFATPVKDLTQIASFADINFASSKTASGSGCMWETNTFPASFDARLNVAPQGISGVDAGAGGKCLKPGIAACPR
jgi:hypothetical protein